MNRKWSFSSTFLTRNIKIYYKGFETISMGVGVYSCSFRILILYRSIIWILLFCLKFIRRVFARMTKQNKFMSCQCVHISSDRWIIEPIKHVLMYIIIRLQLKNYRWYATVATVIGLLVLFIANKICIFYDESYLFRCIVNTSVINLIKYFNIIFRAN